MATTTQNNPLLLHPDDEPNPYEFGIKQFYALKQKVLQYLEQHAQSQTEELALKKLLMEKDEEINFLKHHIASLEDQLEAAHYLQNNGRLVVTDADGMPISDHAAVGVKYQHYKQASHLQQILAPTLTLTDGAANSSGSTTTTTTNVTSSNSTNPNTMQQDDTTTTATTTQSVLTTLQPAEHVVIIQQLQAQVKLLQQDNIKQRQEQIALKMTSDKAQHDLLLTKNKLYHVEKKNQLLTTSKERTDQDLIQQVQAQFNQFNLITKQYNTYLTKYGLTLDINNNNANNNNPNNISNHNNTNNNGSKIHHHNTKSVMSDDTMLNDDNTNQQQQQQQQHSLLTTANTNNTFQTQTQALFDPRYQQLKQKNDLYDNIDQLNQIIEHKGVQIQQYLYVIHKYKNISQKLQQSALDHEQKYKALSYQHQILTGKYEKLFQTFKHTVLVQNKVKTQNERCDALLAGEGEVAGRGASSSSSLTSTPSATTVTTTTTTAAGRENQFINSTSPQEEAKQQQIHPMVGVITTNGQHVQMQSDLMSDTHDHCDENDENNSNEY